MDAIRTMDELGRIVIPMTVRENLGLDAGDKFEMVINGTQIILVRHLPKCSVCDYDDNVQKVNKAYLCEECREKLDAAS